MRSWVAGYSFESVLVGLSLWTLYLAVFVAPDAPDPSDALVGLTVTTGVIWVILAWLYLPSRVLLGESCLDAGHRWAKHQPARLCQPRQDVSGADEGACRGVVVVRCRGSSWCWSIVLGWNCRCRR